MRFYVLACVVLMFAGVSRAERVILDQDLAGRPATEWTFKLPEDAGGKAALYRMTITGKSVSRGTVQVALRPATGARKAVWSTRREMLEVSSEQAVTFELGQQGGPLALAITPPGTGVELSRVKLVEIGKEELIEQLKRDSPKGGTRQNLLRISRFPQGVESGGAIGRDRTDEEYVVAGDENVIGPSGAPALRLKCAQPVRFLLPGAVVQWPFMKHAASCYVRGQGGGVLHVLADGVGVGSKAFTVNSDEWVRVELPFEPQLLARAYQVAVDATGDVYADAFQLEPGDKATDYVKRPEVSLSLPETDASVARIHFDDDPAIVNFVVTGVEKHSLNARVTNIYGDSRQLPDVALVGGDTAQGSLQYVVFAGKSYGVFRVEAWVEDTAGRAVSPVNEIVVTRVPRARWWSGDAPESPFGMHMGPTHRQMVLAKAVGINWVRLHDAGVEAVGWAHVEPVKGEWRWRDENVRRYRDHHLTILGTLQQAPRWASGVDRVIDGYWDNYVSPASNEDWENYCRETTSHYKDSIQAWDVWNEPWQAKFFMKWDAGAKQAVRSPTAAEEYSKLTTTAFMAAKSTMPTNTVLGLNSTGGGHGRMWTRDVAAAGGLNSCDAYGYHSYSAGELAGFAGDLPSRHFHDAFDAAIAKLQPATAPAPASQQAVSSAPAAAALDKPVWMTEGSPTNFSITRGLYALSAPGEDPQDPVELADKTARYMVSTLGQGVSKVFLYHTNVAGHFSPGAGAYQSLVTDDGYPDPSAAAHAVFAWHIEGKKFIRRMEVSPGVFAHVFQGEHRSVAVLTSAPKFEPYLLPGDVIALDVRDLFGNPVAPGAKYAGRTTYVDLQGTEADLVRALAHKGTPRASTQPTTRAVGK